MHLSACAYLVLQSYSKTLGHFAKQGNPKAVLPPSPTFNVDLLPCEMTVAINIVEGKEGGCNNSKKLRTMFSRLIILITLHICIKGGSIPLASQIVLARIVVFSGGYRFSLHF